MKTTLKQNVKNADRKWFVLDAAGKRLGKVAVAGANVLRGKNAADFTPHADGGDFLVILNADKIVVSGSKETQKMYFRHSGYLGNLKSANLAELREKNPTRILQAAISGMLPKNRLRAAAMKRLRLVAGSENPHEAQNPTPLNI